jgi:uncharacterized protein YcbX
MEPVGKIVEIWRYPVTSLGGESVPSAYMSAAGVAGDRQYGLIDRRSGIPAGPEKDHRWRKALHLEARSAVKQLPTISFPGGRSYAMDDPSLNEALSDYFGFDTAVAVYDHSGGHLDFPLTHYRNQHFPVHLLTTGSLKQLSELRQVEAADHRRFRPTVLIEGTAGDGFIENEWIGRRLHLGRINMTVQESTKRCGMTFISQPGLDEDPEVLRSLLRYNKRNLGIYCSVDCAGTIHVGDQVLIES